MSKKSIIPIILFILLFIPLITLVQASDGIPLEKDVFLDSIENHQSTIDNPNTSANTRK